MLFIKNMDTGSRETIETIAIIKLNIIKGADTMQKSIYGLILDMVSALCLSALNVRW